MTREKFNQVCEHQSDYLNQIVQFHQYNPVTDKYVLLDGWMHGVGSGLNAECILIGWCGYQKCIHFSDVSFPNE